MGKFGLAASKPEGMNFSVNHPEIKPWLGCGKEFRDYFKHKYGAWYLRPVKKTLKRLTADAWDSALLEYAKKIQII